MTTTTNLLNISSVPAETLKDGEQQIVARWKSTDKRTIPAANARRAVILPATIWTAAVKTTDANKALELFMLDAVAELAKDYLSTICEESNWARTQVNEDAFSLSSLLTWQAEQAAISGRLNGAEIAEWVKQSATVKAVSTSHGDAIGKAIGDQFVKLASPNHGLTPAKADKLLSTLWQQSDADSTTGLRVMLRLQSIRDKVESSANVLDSIL
jgi:hypothetical protein